MGGGWHLLLVFALALLLFFSVVAAGAMLRAAWRQPD
jgi:hypothetical protein